MKKGLLYYLILFISISSCNQKTIEDEIFCGAEKVQNELLKKVFTSKGYSFLGGEFQTKAEARSGEFSMGLAKGYGFTHKLNDIKYGETYQISVWCKGKGRLVAASDDFYVVEENENKQVDNWDEIKIKVTVPAWNKSNMSVYCWNPEEDTVYFDDFSIRKEQELKEYLPARIQLRLDEDELNFISGNRRSIQKAGQLKPEHKKYFSGIWVQGEVNRPVEMKFKGHWDDHVLSPKVSFRIKSDQPLVERLNALNIQNPRTRNFMSEWIFHQLLEEENVMTTSYFFADVNINSKNAGVYAVEEHFSSEMLKRMNKKGVLLKKIEDQFFDWLPRMNQDTTYPRAVDQATKIIGTNGPANETHVNDAEKCITYYLQADTNIENYIDIEKFAAYIAIMDLTRAYHASRWHNQRWLYNIETQKLEPVVYDGFVDRGYYNNYYPPIMAQSIKYIKDLNSPLRDDYLFALFKNANFATAYTEIALKVSSEGYLNEQLKKREPIIAQYEKAINQEFPGYFFDVEYLYETAERMQNELKDIAD